MTENTKTEGRRKGEEREHNVHNKTTHTTHTALPFPAHNTATQRGSGQHNTREHNTKRNRTMRGAGSNSKTGNTTKRAGTTQDKGTTQHTPLPPFNKTTMRMRRGTPMTDGRVTARAAALHSPCHPPSQRHPTTHDGLTHHQREGRADRGYPTTRTPQTHAHRPHTTHLATDSARHDSSTRQHCSGMSRARATPLHRAARQQHTPPPFHTPRRMDTIHSSTHPLSLTRVHTVNEQQ